MFLPKLTAEQREQIASQVAELIDAFTNQGRMGDTLIPSDLSLFESCREVILDLPRQWEEVLRSQNSDRIERWRRPQATWYHQLRTTHEVFGFARSIEVDRSEGGDHRVIEVVPSIVAQEFQKVIRFIAEEPENEPSGSELPAVLLHIPRYTFYGLAAEEVDEISLVYPFFRERLEVSEPKLKRESLLSLLNRLPSAFGALP